MPWHGRPKSPTETVSRQSASESAPSACRRKHQIVQHRLRWWKARCNPKPGSPWGLPTFSLCLILLPDVFIGSQIRLCSRCMVCDRPANAQGSCGLWKLGGAADVW